MFTGGSIEQEMGHIIALRQGHQPIGDVVMVA